MMCYLACFVAVILQTIVTVSDGSSVPHKVPDLPLGWRMVADVPVPTDHVLKLQLSLQPRNLSALHDIVQQVSDPKSSLYGKHWTAADLNALTTPDAAHVIAVEKWLSTHGVSFKRFEDGKLLEAFVSAETAGRLFSTSFHHATNEAAGQSIVRSGDYWLPVEIDIAVAAVYGLHGLPLPRRKILKGIPREPANVTPSVIDKTYDVSGVTPSGSHKNRQAVAEFQGQTIQPSDIVQFFNEYVPKAIRADKIHKFVGTGDIGRSGIEAALDVDYIMGVAPGVLTEFWYWGGTDFCADLRNWTSTILMSNDAPLVHSVSYGWQGPMEQLGCKDANVKDIEVNFAKLAAKGISVIFASGDSGSGYQPTTCDNSPPLWDVEVEGSVVQNVSNITDEATCCKLSSITAGVKGWTYTPQASAGSCVLYTNVTGRHPKSGAVSGVITVPKLWPSWPASSPWVTSVGATRFMNQTAGEPEMATDQFGSGGGFSTMFEQFNDQSSVVQRYLQIAKSLPPNGSFPTSGRATPDVAALGEGFQVVANGRVESVGGTSASTPTFAGIVSLLNEARLQAGRPAMGYLNPWLYQNAHAFTDITVGTNAIGRGTDPLEYGFSCANGWDPATGLGTPKFDELLKAAIVAGSGSVESVLV